MLSYAYRGKFGSQKYGTINSNLIIPPKLVVQLSVLLLQIAHLSTQDIS